jgi:hypothetical protein
VGATLGELVVLLERINRPIAAATVYGACGGFGLLKTLIHLPAAVDRLRDRLGDGPFAKHVAAGSAMEPAEAVDYARAQIRDARAGV